MAGRGTGYKRGGRGAGEGGAGEKGGGTYQAIFWPLMIGILAVGYTPAQHASVVYSVWSTGSEGWGIRALSLQFRWLRGSLRVAADSLRLIGNCSTAHEPDGGAGTGERVTSLGTTGFSQPCSEKLWRHPRVERVRRKWGDRTGDLDWEKETSIFRPNVKRTAWNRRRSSLISWR